MAKAANIYVLPDQATVYDGGKIYDKFGNLSWFADVSDLEDLAGTGGTDSVFQRRAHKRLPYLNSKAEISVPETTVNVVTGISQSKGALPGYTFTLQAEDEKRDFTTTASISALYTWLKTTAKKDITLYGPTGAPKDPIPAVGEA